MQSCRSLKRGCQQCWQKRTWKKNGMPNAARLEKDGHYFDTTVGAPDQASNQRDQGGWIPAYYFQPFCPSLLVLIVLVSDHGNSHTGSMMSTSINPTPTIYEASSTLTSRERACSVREQVLVSNCCCCGIQSGSSALKSGVPARYLL